MDRIVRLTLRSYTIKRKILGYILVVLTRDVLNLLFHTPMY